MGAARLLRYPFMAWAVFGSLPTAWGVGLRNGLLLAPVWFVAVGLAFAYNDLVVRWNDERPGTRPGRTHSSKRQGTG